MVLQGVLQPRSKVSQRLVDLADIVRDVGGFSQELVLVRLLPRVPFQYSLSLEATRL